MQLLQADLEYLYVIVYELLRYCYSQNKLILHIHYRPSKLTQLVWCAANFLSFLKKLLLWLQKDFCCILVTEVMSWWTHSQGALDGIKFVYMFCWYLLVWFYLSVDCIDSIPAKKDSYHFMRSVHVLPCLKKSVLMHF